MILTKPQAKAVYDAMCALNNVGARIAVTIDNDEIRLYEYKSYIVIHLGKNSHNVETYQDQFDFAKAYGVE